MDLEFIASYSVFQSIKIIRFLHSKGIIYCDLKPSNILLDENGRTKLCDFGLSRKLSDISKTPSSLLPQSKRGTPFYMAPELFHDGGVHSYASDLWALGCVLYECYSGRPPFIGKEFTQLVKSILTDPTPSLPGNPSRPFANLVSSLLIKDPTDRIQWSEICTHAYWRTQLSPVPLPSQPAFDNMIQLSYKPCLTERNLQNKTPPRNRDTCSKSNETPKNRKIQSKQKDASSTTKGVNLLRLSRIAKSNLQRENEKENYRRPLPNNSENDTDVKIENTDMELDFNENTEEDTQDETELAATPSPNPPDDQSFSTPDNEERIIHEVDASPAINTDESRRTDHESESSVPATPPTASPHPKTQRPVEDSGGVVNLSQVLWHQSDLSVRPVMPSKKSDKQSDVFPSLPFDAIPASDLVKLPKDQMDLVAKSIVTILNGNTSIGEKQNVIRYLEMLSTNVDAANILTNGSIMAVLVKMLRQSKASALRVQLASLLGLLIRHSTFIDDDLSSSGILGALNEGLVDRQEKVRRFSMAALGELLFYISTQNDQSKASNPPPESPSKTSSGWQVPSTLISLVTSLLRKGEDDITQLYALRTIENISSQGGYWSTRFTSQDVINNLCYIFRAPGKPETVRLTAGSCLVRLVRFTPPTIQQVMEKLTFKEIAAAISKSNPKEQQICLNLLNMAVLGGNFFPNIGRHLLPLVEDKTLVPNLISLIEHGGEVLRGKTLVFVTLLCKNRKRWLGQFFLNGKLLSTVDRLVVKEKGVYLQQCLEAFLFGVVAVIPGLLETVISDVQQLMGGRRHTLVTALTGRGTSKTNIQLFTVVLNLLGSSSFKHKVVNAEVLQQLKVLIKLVESPFQGRDDFQITLVRVLETMTEEASFIEQNHSILVHEILPSLSIICKGSKDGDARFICLKIWFEVVATLLNDNNGRQQHQELKPICRHHFLPLYPQLMEDEDPIPIYAQKLLQMLVEFNVIQQQ